MNLVRRTAIGLLTFALLGVGVNPGYSAEPTPVPLAPGHVIRIPGLRRLSVSREAPVEDSARHWAPKAPSCFLPMFSSLSASVSLLS
jgi:hypothetical protein